MELGQAWENILDYLDPMSVVNLCRVSIPMHLICSTYLSSRIKRDLDNPGLNLRGDILNSYIEIMSQITSDFVVRGSECYIGLDEAVDRAVRLRNRNLVNYFLAQSPEANQGCRSRELLLAAASSIVNGANNIALDIMTACKFPLDIVINLYYLVLIVNNLYIAAFMSEQFAVEEPVEDEWYIRVSRFIATKGFLPIARALEDRGVSSMFPDFWAIAMGDAAREGYFELVKYLADRGLGYRDYAISEAISGGQYDIVTFLERH